MVDEEENEGLSLLLSKQINTVLGLRKLTHFEIEQKQKRVFSMRPQMHLLIVKPFGTIKSSFTQQFESVLGDDLVLRDELSKPAILGTISKDKRYIGGLPAEIGGKILLIDEFNNIDAFGQRALLSILENQRINRQLGFAVSKPNNICPNEWTNLNVREGVVSGTVNFGCICYAMYYPRLKQSSLFEQNEEQSLLGLKSRFSPNFSCPEHEEIIDLLEGITPFEINDYGKGETRRILIKKDAYLEFIEWYRNFTRKFCEEGDKQLLRKKEIGFLTRTSSDILRFSAHETIKEYNSSKKLLNIEDAELLKEQSKQWTELLLGQYIYEERAGTYRDFIKLYKETPKEKKIYYAQKLNKSMRQIQRWKKKYENEGVKIEKNRV